MDSNKKPLRQPFVLGQTPPLNSPLFPNVAFTSKTPDQMDKVYETTISGSTYSREGHPNSSHLAKIINPMEHAKFGLIAGSGMGAISTSILGLLRKGDHLIANKLLYGGTLALFEKHLPRLGIEVSLISFDNMQNLADALRSNTKMIFTETVSNPTIRITDLENIIKIAKKNDIFLMVDNTFTTPIGCQPLTMGADIVIHSLTKILAGHSDAMLGYIGARDDMFFEPINDVLITMGMTPSPFDCWLTERGLLSFSLRYARSQENAKALATYLSTLNVIKKVHYPSLPSHPDYERCKKLFGKNTGTMLSFEIEGNRTTANQFFEAISPIRFVPTLGDISTTLSHPLSSSHRSLSPEKINEIGLSEGFFRVSLGVENFDFLQDCFSTAIKKVTS